MIKPVGSQYIAAYDPDTDEEFTLVELVDHANALEEQVDQLQEHAKKLEAWEKQSVANFAELCGHAKELTAKVKELEADIAAIARAVSAACPANAATIVAAIGLLNMASTPFELANPEDAGKYAVGPATKVDWPAPMPMPMPMPTPEPILPAVGWVSIGAGLGLGEPSRTYKSCCGVSDNWPCVLDCPTGHVAPVPVPVPPSPEARLVAVYRELLELSTGYDPFERDLPAAASCAAREMEFVVAPILAKKAVA